MESIEIKFLGTGGAFETQLTNSSAIVTHNGQRLLVDCGHSVFPKLINLDLAKTIGGVLVTHLHDDHVGSLSSLILFYQIVLAKGEGRLKVYSGSESARQNLEKFLSHSLGKVEMRADLRLVDELEGVQAIDTFGRHVPGMQTFGYVFSTANEALAYSGDNGDAAFFMAELAKLSLPEHLRVFHELCFYPGVKAHAYYTDFDQWLGKLPIFGYHCNHKQAPADNQVPLVGDFPELNF